jgi:drug/metabolite transporter (DMT)-like permease
MRRTATGRRVSWVTDVLWITLAGLMLLGILLGLVKTIREDALWPGILGLAGSALVAYWVGMGAWRRTRWGQRRFEAGRLNEHEDEPSPG